MPVAVSKFMVCVTIENKQHINDPEGETIQRDLIIKGGYSNIESVRSAKTLKIIIKEKSEKEAEKVIRNLCEELRIYNPVVSKCTVQSLGRIQH
ncbi:MAG: phosphoribosylformylglycinamidine synthase subunit PurS [Nitrososphaeraceae archaeon]|jgi:phosphoribosylformylglycinamidine synthase PurS subunit